MLHLFAPFLHRGSHQTKNPVRVMLMVHFSQIAIETYEKVSFCSPATKKSQQGLRVPGDAFQISTLEAHDAMVKFGSMPQYLGCQKHNKHPSLATIPTHNTPCLHGPFVWPDFSSIKWVLTNHIHLFVIFRLRSTLQITPHVFIFAVSRVYILLPTSCYFFFAIEKNG